MIVTEQQMKSLKLVFIYNKPLHNLLDIATLTMLVDKYRKKKYNEDLEMMDDLGGI